MSLRGQNTLSPSPIKLPRFPRRFSLRVLLVCVAALAVPLAYQGEKVRRQRELIRRVESLGGVITYNHQLVVTGLGGYFDPNIPVDAKPWLRQMLGDDWFRTPHWFRFRGKHISDASVQFLLEYRGPSIGVSLEGTSVTEEGLRALQDRFPDLNASAY